MRGWLSDVIDPDDGPKAMIDNKLPKTKETVPEICLLRLP